MLSNAYIIYRLILGKHLTTNYTKISLQCMNLTKPVSLTNITGAFLKNWGILFAII